MARTFIGQLILRLQAQGLNEAKRVESAVSQIERAAKRLSASPWGANFQRQLDKLGVSSQQIHDVRRSWNSLHNDMNRRGLSEAMKKSDIAAWRSFNSQLSRTPLAKQHVISSNKPQSSSEGC